MADSRGPLNEVAERIDAGFNRLSRLVFLPPLVPALMFVVFTTWGGLTNEGGGNFYMPVMMEAWAFLSGMAGWGAIHLLCLPFTLLVSRWFHGLVTGLCYAGAVALIASLGVMYSEFFGEMKPLAWQRGDERFPFVIRSLVMAPVAATIFIAFLIAVSGRIDSWRAFRPFGSAVARNIFLSAWLAWTGLGAFLLFDRFQDISATAHKYYWGHEVELAEMKDGEPVVENELFTWTDLPPTAESTDNRGWLFGDAAESYELEIKMWILVLWILAPWSIAIVLHRTGRWS